MPQSIEQNSTGAGAIQIGHVEGNVIIQVHRPQPLASVRNDQRDMGLVLGGSAAGLLGISFATPDAVLQLISFFLACVLTLISGIVLAADSRRG